MTVDGRETSVQGFLFCFRIIYNGFINALFINIFPKFITFEDLVNKYSENAKYCKALVSMYINEFRGCQKLILFAFSKNIVYSLSQQNTS